MQRQCIIVTSTPQIQRKHVTAARQYNVNTLLESQSSKTTSTRQSSKIKSTRQCNVNSLLERQGISTTPTRHATLTIKSKSINAAPSRQFRFDIGRRTRDHQLRVKVGKMSRSIAEPWLFVNKTSVSTFWSSSELTFHREQRFWNV